jgi:hypothetical protein
LTARAVLGELLGERLEPGALDWLARARGELEGGASPDRFAELLAVSSRFVKRAPLTPARAERARAAEALEGWDPERWDRLDAARALLVLALRDVDGVGGELTISEAFRHADVGELVALYRALPLLPRPERFRWRMGEGARSNMRAVYEAACCDNPFPALHFDDTAWRSCVLKSLFVGAPLWRVWGLDGRLDAELARMALDFADERRSAGRPVPPALWSCLGTHGGERALRSIERELREGPRDGRAGAALALARAGERERLAAVAKAEVDSELRAMMARAVEGTCSQTAFAALTTA